MTELMLAEAPLIDKLQRVADREHTTAEALLVQAVTEFLDREDQNAELYCVQNENRSFADQRDRVRRTDRQLLPVR